ncbi:MAG: radical SAM protein [bacterium]|nr:radical SAM protein [bacterium]
MRKTSFGESVRVITRGYRDWMTDHPLVVSFEVTDSCTCRCRHCDHGGPVDYEPSMKPGDYRRYIKALHPSVVQVSGGEPLLREDIVEVIHNIKEPNGLLPYIILVSNWSEMTPELYLQLRDAGVNQFSVSLDFPDKRHDGFRGLPGLYDRISKTIPECAALGYDDIVLNTCITTANYEYINASADKAQEWGVNISYSVYSPRRIGDESLFPDSPEQLEVIKTALDRIKERMDGSNWVVNTETTLDETYKYLVDHGRGGCQAGRRFLVVTPDGKMQPCSMQFEKYDLNDRKKMIDEFTANNKCDECYVSIRSYLDKGFWQLLFEATGAFFSFKSQNEFKNK